MSTGKKVFRVLPLDRSVDPSSGVYFKKRRRSASPEEDWLTPSMRTAVDAWAAAQPDPKPSRAEALHRLLERALKAEATSAADRAERSTAGERNANLHAALPWVPTDREGAIVAKGYWIAQVDIRDPEAYAGYVRENAAAFAKFGARFLVRGGPAERVEGQFRSRLVVLEFRDYATALACYRSSEYAGALAIRQRHALADVVIVEGYDGAQPGD